MPTTNFGLNFNKIKKGPVVFFGNEFLDALPIKQFKKEKNNLYEKYLILDKKKKIKEVYLHASANDLFCCFCDVLVVSGRSSRRACADGQR